MELTILMPCLDEALAVETYIREARACLEMQELPRLTWTAEPKGMTHEYR
jgi:hypothetical protein